MGDRTESGSLIETTVREGVLQVRRSGTRWLSSGWNGGFRAADAAYNLSVPTGFVRTDLGAYIGERRREASFPESGPTLLTGLSLSHARGARSDPVSTVATAGLSNPAALPMPADVDAEDPDADTDAADSTGGSDRRRSGESGGIDGETDDADTEGSAPTGTVNLLVVTDRALDDAGLTALLATAVEAKTATLLALTAFSGTTSDAIVVGCDPSGEDSEFAGSATPVGAATRACVRDAVIGSLRSRYSGEAVPSSVGAAEHGVRTTRSTESFRLFDP
jgi:adenosylcobinamide hydrolase